MKRGVLVYSKDYEYVNIGDYIQSIAARQFFDKIDIFLCRESLNNYLGDPVKLILNGWFLHEPLNWPPAEPIQPLFVSFHINSVARDILTNNKSISYFKKYEPIGCRDHDTVDLLREHGIDAYFTGCLTLTLGLTYKRTVSNGSICFVDPHYKTYKNVFSLASYVCQLLTNYGVIKKICQKMFGSVHLINLLKCSAFYKCYKGLFDDDVLISAKYLEAVVECEKVYSDEAGFLLAEQLLTDYLSAAFVVTSRIHCALPCLGMGTPVLYVEDNQQAETSSCRLSGLRELFHVVQCNGDKLLFDSGSKKITKDFSFENKPDYIFLAKKLINQCLRFVNNE